MKKVAGLLLGLLLYFVSYSQLAPSPPQEIGDSLQNILENALAAQSITGGVMGVYVPGEWVWYGASGNAIKVPAKPAGPDFLFRIASISKSFAAVSILQLQEDGLLSLDDSIKIYVPQLVDTIQYGNEMTIRQLLNHTSGIKSNTSNNSCMLAALSDMTQPWTPEELIYCGADMGPAFPPGNGWLYSNTNYCIVARIVEEVSGLSYASYLEQNIFIPADLSRTLVPVTDEVQGDHMGCYWENFTVEDFTIIDPTLYYGYAGIVSCTEDLFKYYAAIDNLTLLGQESYDQMFSGFISTGETGYNYSLGIERENYGAYYMIGHHGEVANTVYMFRFSDLDAYIVYNTTDQGFAPYEYSLIVSKVRNLLLSGVGRMEIVMDAPLSIGPCPAKDYVNVYTNDGGHKVISLFNSYGQLVYSGNFAGVQNRMNVSTLPDGVYFMRINENIRKIVVEN